MNTQKNRVSSHRLAAIVMAMLLTITVTANAQSTQSKTGLSGTWRVQVSLQNCQTGALVGQPFQSLLTFHEGGTLTGTTTNPAFAVGQRTPDYGIWDYQGNQTYTAASEAFLLFPGGAPNGPQFQRGSQRISQSITVNGDSFTSVATVQFFDVNHSAYVSGCALATATRFQ